MLNNKVVGYKMCYMSLCLVFRRFAAALRSSAKPNCFIGRLVCTYFLPASQNYLLMEHIKFTVCAPQLLGWHFVTQVINCKEWLYRGQEHVAALRSAPRRSLANYIFALNVCYTSVPTNTRLLKGSANLRTETELLKSTWIYCTFPTIKERLLTNVVS